jgi:hypothetical protein
MNDRLIHSHLRPTTTSTMIAYDDNTSLDTYQRQHSASLRGTRDPATHAIVMLKLTPIERPPDPQRPFVFNPAARASFCIVFASPTHILGLSARTDALQTLFPPTRARAIAGRERRRRDAESRKRTRAFKARARRNIDNIGHDQSRPGLTRVVTRGNE